MKTETRHGIDERAGVEWFELQTGTARTRIECNIHSRSGRDLFDAAIPEARDWHAWHAAKGDREVGAR